jgi:uncharacterized damage-inducible protein DinB
MAMSPRQHFQDAFAREHDTTQRVLRAYPDDQSDFRPHERSPMAREIAWPIHLGQERLMTKALTTGFDWSKPPAARPPLPATVREIAELADQSYRSVLELLRTADDAKLAGTVKFFVAPKTLGDMGVLPFLWYILCDQVHHRGQLSVYLRMVGKVPSIYGPSGDEPWT